MIISIDAFVLSGFLWIYIYIYAAIEKNSSLFFLFLNKVSKKKEKSKINKQIKLQVVL